VARARLFHGDPPPVLLLRALERALCLTLGRELAGLLHLLHGRVRACVRACVRVRALGDDNSG
jgi:hypothetical protein